MNSRNQPAIITITTDEPPRRGARPSVSHPEVRMRVAPGHTFLVGAISYPAGCTIMLRADIAFIHQQTGILVPVDDAA